MEPEVVERTLKRFQVLKKPIIEKININTASAKNLSKLVYLQKSVSEGIVNYRSDKGTILSFDELSKIEDFPFEKIDRIKLYLTL
ncbi:ComEA family DNA-binding protein [Zobellia nedashkovskayae]